MITNYLYNMHFTASISIKNYYQIEARKAEKKIFWAASLSYLKVWIRHCLDV